MQGHGAAREAEKDCKGQINYDWTGKVGLIFLYFIRPFHFWSDDLIDHQPFPVCVSLGTHVCGIYMYGITCIYDTLTQPSMFLFFCVFFRSCKKKIRKRIVVNYLLFCYVKAIYIYILSFSLCQTNSGSSALKDKNLRKTR